MRAEAGSRSLGFGLFLVLLMAAALGAQTPQGRPYASSADGFSVQFPSEPELSRNNVPVGSATYELHSYVVETGGTALYGGVCNYGSSGAAADPDEILANAKKSVVEHMRAHILG